MATNWSDLGFQVQNGSELEGLARKCHQNGRASRCSQGLYIVWALGSGIEVWAQLNKREELIGLNPHFAGKTRLSAGLMERITRHGFPMDGGFRAVAQPYGSDPIRGVFPFIFDVPDFLLQHELAVPAIHSVQLAAFAQQCALYLNEADMAARTARMALTLTPHTFLPMGLRGENGEPLAEPLPSAMFCGPVLDASLSTNPISKTQFWWLKVQSAAGEVDVVADAELLPRGARSGMLLQCTAWLSGRVMN
jgi:hypothetical protein